MVVPRYPWFVDSQAGLTMSAGHPTFSMVCYKGVGESTPVTVIPLENARVVVETSVLTESGVLVIIFASAKCPMN